MKMPPKKKTERATKIKKKNWYQILAPKMFNNAVLGETSLTESKLAMGKPISQNLMTLTNDIKKQNIKMNFVVDKVEGEKAYTKVVGYQMVAASLKRLTRRRSDKIELSLVYKTSDNVRIRIKPLVFTRAITKGSITNSLNNALREHLQKTISKMSFDALVNDLVNHRFQVGLRNALKKIYPLRNVQIKYMKIEKGKTSSSKKPKEAVPEEKTEEPEEPAEEEQPEGGEEPEEAEEEESSEVKPKDE